MDKTQTPQNIKTAEIKLMPPIFCISLARAKERRVVMRQKLDALGTPYEIIDAIDGKDLDMSELNGRLRQDLCFSRIGWELTTGEIGCYLSHYNLWQKMVAENIESALILEDDAEWNEDFASVICALQNIAYEWNVILLAGDEKNRIDGGTLCSIGKTKYRLVRYRQWATSTVGYLINLAGAKKLCEFCREIREPIDLLYSAYWRSGIAFYRMHPAGLVRPAEVESTIKDRPEFKDQRKNLPLKYLITTFLWRKWNRKYRKFYCWTHPLPSSRKRGYVKSMATR